MQSWAKIGTSHLLVDLCIYIFFILHYYVRTLSQCSKDDNFLFPPVPDQRGMMRIVLPPTRPFFCFLTENARNRCNVPWKVHLNTNNNVNITYEQGG